MKKVLTLIVALYSYSILISQAYPDRHSTSKTDAWISCEKTLSPHSQRGEGHWIMYDLGHNYGLTTTQIWNLNTPNYDGAGIQDMVIDYSIDGITWREFGNFRLEQGRLSGFYEGQIGPDFGGLIMRYLLITAISNHGHNECFGLGELKFEARQIPVSVQTPTSFELDLSISPNPASDIVSISIAEIPKDGLKFHLTDMFGRMIVKGDVTQNVSEINISEIPAGSYFVSLINPFGIKTKKLIIIR